MTTDERYTVLSALIDREPVDPAALADALDDPAGRAYLVDFVRVRARVSEEFALDERAGTPPAQSATKARWLARAAALLVPLALGAFGGAWWVEQHELRPPTPDRVIQVVRGVEWQGR